MLKQSDKYQNIINKLINKSFPELKGKRIIISETKILDFNYSAGIFYFLFFFWIAVHPRSRNYSYEGLVGLFAHEISHLDLIAKMNLSQKLTFAFKWLFTKKQKRDFERDADLHTIKKGYGKNLFRFRNESSKTYSKEELKKVMSRGYLTSRQIEKMLRD